MKTLEMRRTPKIIDLGTIYVGAAIGELFPLRRYRKRGFISPK